MAEDPHPSIKRQFLADGGRENADIDMENFISVQQLKLVPHQPRERAATLEQLDDLLASDKTTLRQRSQLLRLRQRMAFTHNAMLKSGR